MNHGKYAAPKQRRHKLTTVLKELLVTFLIFAGLALIAAGLWHIWPPVALIFSGVICLYMSWCVHMTAKSPEKDG